MKHQTTTISLVRLIHLTKCVPNYTESSCHLGGTTAGLDKKKIPSFNVYSMRRVFWQQHGQCVLQHGRARRVSFHCSGLSSLLMKCEECVKLSISVWSPQRGQAVMRAGLWPCGAAWWRWPYGVGEGCFQGGRNRCWIADLLPKALCQPAPVRWC